MLLILGSSGHVGSKIFHFLTKNERDVIGISRSEIDYSNPKILKEFLRSKKPRFLINAAGYTGKPNVDACELVKGNCLDGNAVLPGVIRQVCEELKITWGHVSSGCIYSGRRSDGSGWTENDSPNFSFRSPPCSFYSGSKALGEEVLEAAENCYIWRLRIPFNEERSPRNYLQKLLNYDSLLEAENSVSHLDEFCQKCVESIEKEVEPGIYNMTNPGSVTTTQVTEWMIEQGVTDKQFQFFEDEQHFMNKAAKTPRSNCVLDTSKAEMAGIGMRPVEEAMRETMQKMARPVGV
jgi:UDP-glucose 4,6-dehydratase